MNFWKIVTFGTFVLNWLQEASQDGKITANEVAELVNEAARLVEIEIDIDL